MASPSFFEDHLVEQPAIQLMQHELGWDVMNCFGEPSSQELRRSGWEVPGKAEMLKTEMLKRRKAIEPFFANHSAPTILRQGYERHGLRTAEATKVKAVEEMGILNDGSGVAFGFAETSFWVLNERGRRERVSELNPASGLSEASRVIDKLRRPNSWVLYTREPDRQCNRLIMNELLFDWKKSVAVSPLGETESLGEILVRKPMKSLFSRYRENVYSVKIGLSFTKNSLFTTT